MLHRYTGDTIEAQNAPQSPTDVGPHVQLGNVAQAQTLWVASGMSLRANLPSPALTLQLHGPALRP